MPLPWKKKSSSARISRLVADLQAPPKRGGSLVVETGFPTSLVDLFVKNRDRLKKPSKKTKNNHSNKRPDPGDSRTALDPPASDPGVLAVASDRNTTNPPALPPMRAQILQPPVEGEVGIPPISTEVPDQRGPGGSRGDRVCLAVFAVVALAMCTKGLAVGITFSAAALLLLEHFGITIPCLFELRSGAGTARDAQNHRNKRGSFVFEGTEQCHFTEEEVGGGGSDLVGYSDGEIETLEQGAADPGREDDSSCPIPDPRCLSRDMRWGCSDAEAEVVQLSGKQGAKNKPKIMKRFFVPIRMRNQKKGERKECQS